MPEIRKVKEIGHLVKVRRKSLGLRQSDAAGLMGVGIRFLSELERGKETLAIGKVLQVLNSLQIKISLSSDEE